MKLYFTMACSNIVAHTIFFAMNTQVTATGMHVQAQAEGGIVISNNKTEDGSGTATADALNSSTAELIPTSTANTTNWYHAVSDDANNAKKEQADANYTTLSITENAGLGQVTMGNETKAVYLLNTFYIKSSAEAITLSEPACLYINSVEVELLAEQKTADLNKALRVAIVLYDGTTTVTKIFAPVEGGETSYKLKNVATTAIGATVKNTSTTLRTIPAFSSTSPIEAKIYVYFEGEDSNCKSSNLAATIDSLKVCVCQL